MPTPAREVGIADAIVGELNDAARSWHTAFSAVRSWLPVYKDVDLATLKVSVVPITLDEGKIDRTRERMDYQIAIDLQQRIDTAALAASVTAQIDALTLLAEAVHDFYRTTHELTGVDAPGAWMVLKATRPDIYDLSTLYATNTWETVILVTVQGYC